jgi:hypothetical protein
MMLPLPPHGGSIIKKQGKPQNEKEGNLIKIVTTDRRDTCSIST